MATVSSLKSKRFLKPAPLTLAITPSAPTERVSFDDRSVAVPRDSTTVSSKMQWIFGLGLTLALADSGN